MTEITHVPSIGSSFSVDGGVQVFRCFPVSIREIVQLPAIEAALSIVNDRIHAEGKRVHGPRSGRNGFRVAEKVHKRYVPFSRGGAVPFLRNSREIEELHRSARPVGFNYAAVSVCLMLLPPSLCGI